MKKINWKQLIFFIVITYAIVFLFSLFTISDYNFAMLNKPAFMPPSIIFPIVWNILYLLMAISVYIAYNNSTTKNSKYFVITTYFIQLITNALWPIFFFKYNMILFSFWWILLLIAFVITMMYVFYKVKKEAMYLNIPYLLWLIFAAFLNYSIYLIN